MRFHVTPSTPMLNNVLVRLEWITTSNTDLPYNYLISKEALKDFSCMYMVSLIYSSRIKEHFIREECFVNQLKQQGGNISIVLHT